jgi:HEAT repeats
VSGNEHVQPEQPAEQQQQPSGHHPQPHRSRRAAKLIAGSLFVCFALVAGVLIWFWTSRSAQLSHLTRRTVLAPPSAYLIAAQGVTPEARQPLLDGIAEGDPGLRAACAYALSTLQEPDLVPVMGTLALEDEDATVRQAGVRALARLGFAKAAEPYLILTLEDPIPKVQQETCQAIGTLLLDGQLRVVIEKLVSQDLGVRQGAQEGLEAFTPGEESFGADRDAWLTWYQEDWPGVRDEVLAEPVGE